MEPKPQASDWRNPLREVMSNAVSFFKCANSSNDFRFIFMVFSIPGNPESLPGVHHANVERNLEMLLQTTRLLVPFDKLLKVCWVTAMLNVRQ